MAKGLWTIKYKIGSNMRKGKKKSSSNRRNNWKKELNNSSIAEYKEFLQSHRGTIVSELKLTTTLETNKPLGEFGDITVNELIIKGLNAIDTPLVQMIREHVDVKVAGSFLTSMILYKTIVNLYVKSAYSKSLTEVLKSAPSTRGKEIALFMIVGAPFIAGLMLTTNKIIGPKVIINLVSNNELEGSSSVSSSFSLFLLFNKLPSWLKAILKYLASYCILLIIVKIIGYKSNIVLEIYSQFYFILGYFLKIWCILNILVIIYFIWKLYVIVMFAENKEYLNPEVYPKFIKDELIESKEIALNLYLKEPNKVYKHYLKLIFLYFSIVLVGLTVLSVGSHFLIPPVS